MTAFDIVRSCREEAWERRSDQLELFLNGFPGMREDDEDCRGAFEEVVGVRFRSFNQGLSQASNFVVGSRQWWIAYDKRF